MKSILYIFVLLPFGLCCQTNIDSLNQIWLDDTQNDSSRARAIISITKSFLYNNPDTTYQLAEIVHAFGKEKNFKKMVVTAHVLKGASASLKGDLEHAAEQYNKGYALAKAVNDSSSLFNIRNNLSIIYRKQGDMTKALDVVNENIELLKYFGAPDYRRKMTVACLSNIGQTYRMFGDNENGKKYYKEALQYQTTKKEIIFASTLNNLGHVYLQDNNLDTALLYMYQSLDIYEEYDQLHGYATCLGNIGNVYKRMKDSLRAMECYRESLNISKTLNDKNNTMNVLLDIAAYYYLFKNLDSAEYYGLAAHTIAAEQGDIFIDASISHLLYNIYKETGEEDRSLKFYERHISLRDSFYSLENQMAIVEEKYKSKHEEELARENASSILFQNILFALLGLILLLILFVIYLKKRNQHVEQQQQILLEQLNELKEKAIVGIVTSEEKEKGLILDKEKIEQTIDAKLNPTDWKILNLLLNSPTMTNKEIAQSVSLSYDGASSSLRKMYRVFDLNVTKNHKMSLIIKATKISQEL